jgi:hypothetical protein
MNNENLIQACQDLIDAEELLACDEERMPSSRKIESLKAIIGQLQAADNMRQAFRPLVDLGNVDVQMGNNTMLSVPTAELTAACEAYHTAGNCTLAADLLPKLERECGLCTSVGVSEAENMRRIRFILSAYELSLPLQYAERLEDNWQTLTDFPSDFSNTAIDYRDYRDNLTTVKADVCLSIRSNNHASSKVPVGQHFKLATDPRILKRLAFDNGVYGVDADNNLVGVHPDSSCELVGAESHRDEHHGRFAVHDPHHDNERRADGPNRNRPTWASTYSLTGTAHTNMQPGCGAPLFIEPDDNGHPVAYAWSEIDGQDFTHKVSFASAKDTRQPV